MPKFRSCHKAIMVITGRAHCYTFCIFRSLLMQFEHSRSWIGWRVSIRRSLFALCIAHCSQFEHSGDSTLQSSQCVTVHPVPKFRSCHKAIMVITGRAHCYTFCIYIYIYTYTTLLHIYITLLHLGVVEHSVRRASGCSFAILQSPRPLWSFEHSGPMTLCACVDALMSPCCTACVW